MMSYRKKQSCNKSCKRIHYANRKKHPSPLRKWMFFFQNYPQSLSHLILIHMSYHEERRDAL